MITFKVPHALLTNLELMPSDLVAALLKGAQVCPSEVKDTHVLYTDRHKQIQKIAFNAATKTYHNEGYTSFSFYTQVRNIGITMNGYIYFIEVDPASQFLDRVVVTPVIPEGEEYQMGVEYLTTSRPLTWAEFAASKSFVFQEHEGKFYTASDILDVNDSEAHYDLVQRGYNLLSLEAFKTLTYAEPIF